VVLDHVTGHVSEGAVVALVGPSGSGKSTLLRCLNRLERPDAGSVLIDEIDLMDPSCDIRKVREHVGMVFQNFNLFPNMTVLENLTFAPCRVLKKPREEAEQTALKLLERVGLKGKEKAYPSRLSGGQKQRVAIARSLAMNPTVMLFDEPTSSLDPEMVKEVLDVIKSLVHVNNRALIIVTHEMQFAREVCDEVWFLDHGKILERAKPADFFTAPTTQRAKEFLAKVL
jgi:ABC-type polar amino acid transport system ATPase subunit